MAQLIAEFEPKDFPELHHGGYINAGLTFGPALLNCDVPDVITTALLPIEQAIRINAYPRGLARHRHRDRLLAGADAMHLHVERLTQFIAIFGGGEYPHLHP